nr:hypothetical protein [Blautia caecimuris]
MDVKKVRETIEDFKNLAELLQNKESPAVEHCNIAIEALEKQLPKKVIIEDWCPSYCPSCGYELSEDLGDGFYRHPTFIKRCPNPDCGQKLDWSE